MPRLEPEVARERLASLSQWRHDEPGGAIARQFTFADCSQAPSFMTPIAIVAEKNNHHPEWFDIYNRVDIPLTTHDVKGLSQSDIDMAHYADEAFARFQPDTGGTASCRTNQTKL